MSSTCPGASHSKDKTNTRDLIVMTPGSVESRTKLCRVGVKCLPFKGKGWGRVKPGRGGRAWVWALSASLRKGIKQGAFRELTRLQRMRKKQRRARRKREHLLFSELSFTGQTGRWGLDSSAAAFGTLAAQNLTETPSFIHQGGRWERGRLWSEQR